MDKRDLIGIQTFHSLENVICALRELIDIRDGYKECNGLINSDLDEFILSLCTC